MKKLSCILLLSFIATSCKYFENHEGEVQIPDLSEEQLQEARYKTKTTNNYKENFLDQQKTPTATITLFNVIPYQIKDEIANVGEGYSYMIIDVGVDNPTDHSFPIAAFTKSCNLTTSDSTYRFSNIPYALKMYSLQTDSSEIDLTLVKRFTQDTMPAKDFYRAKLFAYEISNDEKDALYFRYKVGNQKYSFKVRDKQY